MNLSSIYSTPRLYLNFCALSEIMSPHETPDKDPVKDMHHTVSSDGGDGSDAVLTKAQAKRLLLKTDLVVMPLAVLSMTLAFLDKVLIAIGREVLCTDLKFRTPLVTLPSLESRMMPTSSPRSTAGSAASSTLVTLPWSSLTFGS